MIRCSSTSRDHLEPQKGGDKAYALLRDALKDTNKVGVAKVVIKTRQYLAGVKPEDGALVLELMHFADELADAEKLHVPKKLEVGKREMNMAKSLIDSMSSKWHAEKYKDDYREALMEVIEEKVEAGGKEIEEKPRKAPKPTKVIDLVSVFAKEPRTDWRERKKQTANRAQKRSNLPGKQRSAAAGSASNPRSRHSERHRDLTLPSRKSFSLTFMKSLNRFADPVYCIMRLIVGLMFACHGAQKILGWFAKPGQPPAPPDLMMTIGGWIELICGLLIAIGLLTRPAAFLASGMMAVAYFMVTPAVDFSRS